MGQSQYFKLFDLSRRLTYQAIPLHVNKIQRRSSGMPIAPDGLNLKRAETLAKGNENGYEYPNRLRRHPGNSWYEQ